MNVYIPVATYTRVSKKKNNIPDPRKSRLNSVGRSGRNDLVNLTFNRLRSGQAVEKLIAGGPTFVGIIPAANDTVDVFFFRHLSLSFAVRFFLISHVPPEFPAAFRSEFFIR